VHEAASSGSVGISRYLYLLDVALDPVIPAIEKQISLLEAELDFGGFRQRRQSLGELFFLDEVFSQSKSFRELAPFQCCRSLELRSLTVDG